MGEISEGVLDGMLCSECRVFLGESTGYPRYCHSCHVRMKADSYKPKQLRRRKTLKRFQDDSGRWRKFRRFMTPEEKRADNRRNLERKKRAKARLRASEGKPDA